MVDVFSGRLLVSKDGRSVDPEEALQNKVVGFPGTSYFCSPMHPDQSMLHERPGVFLKCSLMVCFILNFFPLSDLKKKYNITAIPKLVIVKQTGEVITDKGRKQIRDKGLSCFRNWLEGADIFQNFSI
ncbi:NXNL2 protein, partial [Bucorvus abyssinicus]|nr:NXNL2 protein [Bucorvus abyssinicus]